MRKACLASDVHKMDTPASIKYSSMISRYRVRIAILIASLNDLDICACDTRNYYVNKKCRENLWVKVETEFGPSYRVSDMIIFRALYGLKYIREVCCAKLEDTLNYMGYRSTESDLNLWFKWDVKTSGE